jgi:hypothetical protein
VRDDDTRVEEGAHPSPAWLAAGAGGSEVGAALRDLVVVVRELQIDAACSGSGYTKRAAGGSTPSSTAHLCEGRTKGQAPRCTKGTTSLRLARTKHATYCVTVEHSTCQPGRPGPHGASHTGSPLLLAARNPPSPNRSSVDRAAPRRVQRTLACFHNAKSSGFRLVPPPSSTGRINRQASERERERKRQTRYRWIETFVGCRVSRGLGCRRPVAAAREALVRVVPGVPRHVKVHVPLRTRLALHPGTRQSSERRAPPASRTRIRCG